MAAAVAPTPQTSLALPHCWWPNCANSVNDSAHQDDSSTRTRTTPTAYLLPPVPRISPHTLRQLEDDPLAGPTSHQALPTSRRDAGGAGDNQRRRLRSVGASLTLGAVAEHNACGGVEGIEDRALGRGVMRRSLGLGPTSSRHRRWSWPGSAGTDGWHALGGGCRLHRCRAGSRRTRRGIAATRCPAG
jgi:hypothetical protein